MQFMLMPREKAMRIHEDRPTMPVEDHRLSAGIQDPSRGSQRQVSEVGNESLSISFSHVHYRGKGSHALHLLEVEASSTDYSTAANR